MCVLSTKTFCFQANLIVLKMLDNVYNVTLSFIGLNTVFVQCYVIYLIFVYTPENMKDYRPFLIQLTASFLAWF